jgi:hypothetical protein
VAARPAVRSWAGGPPVNPFAAVAIIVAVFFIAGLIVGFLIVMALPALVSRRGSDRWDVRPSRPEPRPWPSTRPFSTDPYADADGEDDGTDDQGGPPDRPWWTGGP